MGKVFVVHKTHLDVGFTDLAAEVVRQYVTQFVPAAIRMAQELNGSAREKRFVWTVSSWLLYEALERLKGRDLRQLDEAIVAGSVVWHALPFTSQSEYQGRFLFKQGLRYSSVLDRRYGRRTIAAKMTDVPGHTRGIVRPLAEAGVRFLHIGVNPSSKPPDVPPLFVWRDTTGHEIVVAYTPRYGGITVLPGAGLGLFVAHTNDNTGPPTSADVAALHADLKARHPGASIEAAPLDIFAAAAWENRRRLPVLRGEIGDTWIHGPGSDPTKTRGFMALRRLGEKWVADGKADAPTLDGFLTNLGLVGEHTWGLNTIYDMATDGSYRRDDFNRAKDSGRYLKFERSWYEQRKYLDSAVSALPGGALRREARAALAEGAPCRPDFAGTEPVKIGKAVRFGRFQLSVDASGALNHLVDTETGNRFASRGRPIGLFTYQTYSREDYARFWHRYAVNKVETRIWSYPAFIKVMQPADCPSADWTPRAVRAGVRRGGDCGDELVVRMTMDGPAHDDYGAPGELVSVYRTSSDGWSLELDFQWFGKPACRMPEACWLSFVPDVGTRAKWTLVKMGEPVSPRDVVRHGNRVLHSVDDRVECVDGTRALSIRTLDTPFVAAGHRRVLDFCQALPDPRDGVHFNLFNNLWETNFPLWFDEDARFRFTLTMDGTAGQGGA